jgi:hypothetical protein
MQGFRTPAATLEAFGSQASQIRLPGIAAPCGETRVSHFGSPGRHDRIVVADVEGSSTLPDLQKELVCRAQYRPSATTFDPAQGTLW